MPRRQQITPNEYVTQLRESRKLTITEMAKETGINRSVLSRIESGVRVTGDNALLIASWLHRKCGIAEADLWSELKKLHRM